MTNADLENDFDWSDGADCNERIKHHRVPFPHRQDQRSSGLPRHAPFRRRPGLLFVGDQYAPDDVIAVRPVSIRFPVLPDPQRSLRWLEVAAGIRFDTSSHSPDATPMPHRFLDPSKSFWSGSDRPRHPATLPCCSQCDGIWQTCHRLYLPGDSKVTDELHYLACPFFLCSFFRFHDPAWQSN